MSMQGLSNASLVPFFLFLALAIACFAIQAIRRKSVASGHFFIGCMMFAAQVAIIHADLGLSSAEGYSFAEAMVERTQFHSMNWFVPVTYLGYLLSAFMFFFMSAVVGKPAQPIPRFIPASERLRWN